MNLFIIGASGFIGQTLVKEGTEQGFTVIGTEHTQKLDSFEHYDIRTDHILDIIEKYQLKPEETYTIICTAVSAIDACFENKVDSYEINVKAMKRLMDTLSQNQFKFAFISSDAVYDGKKGYYTEVDLPTAETEYGKQKAMVEDYIRENMPGNLVFRISLLLDTVDRKGNLLSSFYQSVQKGTPIHNMKYRIFCPTYVVDLAKIMILCFDKELQGLYHVANHEIYTRYEIAEQFAQLYDSDIDIEEHELEWFPFQDTRHRKTCLISEKLQDKLKFHYTSVETVMYLFFKNNE